MALRTGKGYRESLHDGREVWINGERVKDVTSHPAFRPIVDMRARIYDMAHEDRYRDVMSYAVEDTGERCAIGLKPPRTREDWIAKHAAVGAVMREIGGVVTRVGDETTAQEEARGKAMATEMAPAQALAEIGRGPGHER